MGGFVRIDIDGNKEIFAFSHRHKYDLAGLPLAIQHNDNGKYYFLHRCLIQNDETRLQYRSVSFEYKNSDGSLKVISMDDLSNNNFGNFKPGIKLSLDSSLDSKNLKLMKHYLRRFPKYVIP